MIFNECGEIVTIENRYKSIDQWLNESYLIDNYLNEGKISAGIEKAIRWLIDGFMHIVDILKNISNSKAIKYIKQHRKEILDKITNEYPLTYDGDGGYTNKLYDFENLSNIDFKKFDEMCKNPIMHQNMGYDEMVKEVAPFTIKPVKKQDIPILITNALDTIIDNTKLSNNIRRSISSLKVLSKETDIDRQFTRDIVKLGKVIISRMQNSIKECLRFIQKAMNGEYDKDWKHGREEYDKSAADVQQDYERIQKEARDAFYQGLKSGYSGFAGEINEILNGI